jgi:hypothetical protein
MGTAPQSPSHMIWAASAKVASAEQHEGAGVQMSRPFLASSYPAFLSSTGAPSGARTDSSTSLT